MAYSISILTKNGGESWRKFENILESLVEILSLSELEGLTCRDVSLI